MTGRSARRSSTPPGLGADLGHLQLSLLVRSAFGMRNALPTAAQWEDLVSRAGSARAVTSELVDREVASEVLALVAGGSPSGLLGLPDRVEYAGRLMPTVVGMTAYAYSRSSPALRPWSQRLPAEVRGYEDKSHRARKVRRTSV
jgi:hypothetical protein